MQFIDTNIILRYITGDQPEQAERCYRLFQSVRENAVQVTTSEAVIAECVHVLSSMDLYKRSRAEIREHLMNLIVLEGFMLPNKTAYYDALDTYTSVNIDFVDALNAAHMQRLGITEVLSFDRDYNRIPGIRRVEP